MARKPCSGRHAEVLAKRASKHGRPGLTTPWRRRPSRLTRHKDRAGCMALTAGQRLGVTAVSIDGNASMRELDRSQKGGGMPRRTVVIAAVMALGMLISASASAAKNDRAASA